MSQHPFRLRKNLDQPIETPKWPSGFSCRTLSPGDAASVHALLRIAYGIEHDVPGFDDWWQKFSGDTEFDARLCFLVFGDGRLAGAALCWTSAFLKDLVVHPDARRLGLGANLLRLVFCTFRERDAGTVDLKVDANNANAIRLYEKVGMHRVPWAG